MIRHSSLFITTRPDSWYSDKADNILPLTYAGHTQLRSLYHMTFVAMSTVSRSIC